MTRWRFVHAADLHLDTPFAGLARLGEGVPELLRDASLTAFDNLVNATLHHGAHALLLAGDLYDGPARGLRAQLRLRDGLQKLSDNGVRVFLVRGNHDPVAEGWSAVREWPGGVTEFPADGVTGAPIHVAGREAARVYGISYARRDTADNLARCFPAERGAPFGIGLLHANAGNNPEHAAYAPCTPDDLRAAGIDYWALGHVHRHQTVLDGAPWAVYPGCLQGRSPRPSEQGPKGAVLVTVDGDRVADTTFLPLDVVRFEERTVDAAPFDSVADLADALAETGRQAVTEADGRPVILRAGLTGRSPLHATLRRQPDTLETLRDDLAARDDRVWWDRLDDATAAPVDREAIRRRGDFSADLLDRADALRADPGTLRATLRDWAEPADRRLRGLVDALDADTARAVLDAAEDEALDRLEDE